MEDVIAWIAENGEAVNEMAAYGHTLSNDLLKAYKLYNADHSAEVGNIVLKLSVSALKEDEDFAAFLSKRG